MRKAITFLGFNPRGYDETTYVRSDTGASYSTPLFPEALIRLYAPDCAYVLLTETAATRRAEGALHSNWEELKRRVGDSVPLFPIHGVPEGTKQADIWLLFELLTASLDQGDQVIFDITHGFRSLPIVAFAAIGFLRTAKKVNIEALVYGAYEARNKATGETPIFDLTSMVVLLDWTAATDQLLRTGDGREIGSILTSTQGRIFRETARGQNEPRMNLIPASQRLTEVSRAMALARPMETLKAAADVDDALDRAETEIAQYAPPLGVVLEQIREVYAAIACREQNACAPESLVRQLRLIDLYIQRGQGIQALTLAREWIVSVVCWKLGRTDVRKRQPVEDALGAHWYLSSGRPKEKFREAELRPQIESLDTRRTISAVWGMLTNDRNDVDHCGMREKPLEASRLLKHVSALKDPLQALAKEFGLSDPQP